MVGLLMREFSLRAPAVAALAVSECGIIVPAAMMARADITSQQRNADAVLHGSNPA